MSPEKNEYGSATPAETSRTENSADDSRVAVMEPGAIEVLDDSPLFDEVERERHIYDNDKTTMCGIPISPRGATAIPRGVPAIEAMCPECVRLTALEWGVRPTDIVCTGNFTVVRRRGDNS